MDHYPARLPHGSVTEGLRAQTSQRVVFQPVPRVSSGARVNFLSGLVTTEAGMIAVIDLPNLLSLQVDDDVNPLAAAPAALSA